MRRLSQAGFKKEFVDAAILPDWWDENCAEDQSLLQDVEIRVARFLNLPLASVRDPNTALTAPAYPGAQLRRVRDVDRDRLGPAIHSALRIAAAVVRNLRSGVPDQVELPPSDGIAWRKAIKRTGPAINLDDLVRDLWLRGIPVVPLDMLPSPSFQGISCIVEDRPVILLGYKHDEPGRVAFLAAHEAGHIVAGDCAPGQPVVDEEDEVMDDSDIELRADHYARQVLVGAEGVPLVEGENFKQLAQRAADLERETGADASLIIYALAAQTGDYAKASMAVKALYRAVGARRTLRQHFVQRVEFDDASESDRALLRCVHGHPELNEVTP